MSTSAQPIVRHFRQILLWPVQLMPLDPSSPANGHWEELDRCPGDNPWHALEDEFTNDPAQFQERHYREFVTFLPHVQRFLYGQGRSRQSRLGYGESPIRVFRREDIAAVRLGFEDGNSADFAIRHVDLYFFYDLDVAILVVEFHRDDLALDKVQEILFRFGRAFPTGWETDGRASHCMRSVQWLDVHGNVLSASDLDNREKYLSYTAQHRSARVGTHWEYVMRPMIQHHSDEAGPLRYRLIEYHRMPRITYLALDDPFVLSDEDFLRLAHGLSPDDGQGLPYSDATLEQMRRDSFYDRFWAPGRGDLRASTRVTCNGHAMVTVGTARDPWFVDYEHGMLGQFRHQYFLIALLAHFHKAALLMMSNRAVLAISRLDHRDAESVRSFKEEIRAMRAQFLRFDHRYWFHEVSNQTMARDLFGLFGKHLGTDAMFQEVREEVIDMAQYLDSDDSRRQGDSVLRLTVVTILGLVGTIVTGFLGMNLLSEADNPQIVKVVMFLSVLLPTMVLTMLTVANSSRLSEMLDVLSDDTMQWKERLAQIQRILERPTPAARRAAQDAGAKAEAQSLPAPTPLLPPPPGGGPVASTGDGPVPPSGDGPVPPSDHGPAAAPGDGPSSPSGPPPHLDGGSPPHGNGASPPPPAAGPSDPRR